MTTEKENMRPPSKNLRSNFDDDIVTGTKDQQPGPRSNSNNGNSNGNGNGNGNGNSNGNGNGNSNSNGNTNGNGNGNNNGNEPRTAEAATFVRTLRKLVVKELQKKQKYDRVVFLLEDERVELDYQKKRDVGNLRGLLVTELKNKTLYEDEKEQRISTSYELDGLKEKYISTRDELDGIKKHPIRKLLKLVFSGLTDKIPFRFLMAAMQDSAALVRDASVGDDVTNDINRNVIAVETVTDDDEDKDEDKAENHNNDDDNDVIYMFGKQIWEERTETA